MIKIIKENNYYEFENIIDKDRIQLLSKHLKVPYKKINVSNYNDKLFVVDMPNEKRKYFVLTEDEAHNEAYKSIESLIDDVGILGAFSNYFTDWIMYNAVDQDVLEEFILEDYISYANDIEQENDDTFSDRLVAEMYDEGILVDDDFKTMGELYDEGIIDDKDYEGDYETISYKHLIDGVDIESKKEEFAQEKLDEILRLDDWFISNFGKDFFEKFLVDNNAVDMDMVIEEVIDEDGVANSIAGYDGLEIDLGEANDGERYFAYRVN